jgi:hypothetical protein
MIKKLAKLAVIKRIIDIDISLCYINFVKSDYYRYFLEEARDLSQEGDGYGYQNKCNYCCVSH